MRKLFLIAALLAALGGASPGAWAGADGEPTNAEKLQPYIGCLNQFSESAFKSRERYASWADKAGPTGKERVIYGTYTISDPSGCSKSIAAANAVAPHDKELETAGTAYAESLAALAPLLKEADDYYTQESYKDDAMAKGKALHPKLVAAWSNFAAADDRLRAILERLNDEISEQELAEVEKSEGRNAHYLVLNLMGTGKKLMRAELEEDTPHLDKIQPALDDFDKAQQELDHYADAHKEAFEGVHSFGIAQLLRTSKDYLVSAKKLMRRVRDKEPYSNGEQMMLSQAGAGWMVDGSPPRVNRDYNQLVDAYNHMH